MSTMKFLKPSGFVDTIEYTSQVLQEVLRLGRKPQVYSYTNSELTEPKYYFVMKRLGGAKR